ncbi:hypothetical protein Pmar_PMAR012525 [Perkinsus marinus ATCC 50983]|uniref:Protein kinase domain-containing protein n=1 Tax=Perkinsus marinus (strain ATCC 50983 / TXsc) TaxID=423536 RepID=C5K7K9_PERM5|nr:hypothetical protein Pmar_PMAR012525 [Perkinsus marinus ATCC 50983]EER19544.1 hypothetical protein Pmar_PMAR012525 [Perkinsus marinus ATCC 50983]|eukprot:XP_002787748.1 hypothetical protein Pmar_PMAR012525 [Perkinsus marinus ATCC 50983]
MIAASSVGVHDHRYVNRDTVRYFLQRRRLLRRYVLGNSRSLESDAEFGELFCRVKDLKSGGSGQGQSSEVASLGRSAQNTGRKRIWLVQRTQCGRRGIPVAPGALLVCKCIDIEALFQDIVEDGERGYEGGFEGRHQGRSRRCIREDTLVEMFLSKLLTRFFGCPNFDRLIDIMHDSTRVYFLFEFFEGGDLLDYMTARALQSQSRRRASVAKSAPPDESGELCGESPEESVSEDAASPMSCPGGDSSKVRLTVDRQGLRKFFEEVTTPGKEDKRIQQPHQPRADEGASREEIVAVSNTSKEATMKIGGEVEAEEEETTTAVVRLNVKVRSLYYPGQLEYSYRAAPFTASSTLGRITRASVGAYITAHWSGHISGPYRFGSVQHGESTKMFIPAQIWKGPIPGPRDVLVRATAAFLMISTAATLSLWLAGDMWSVGVVGLVMCLGGPLWASATADDEKYRHFLQHAGPDVFYYLSQVQHLPSELAALLAGLLQPQPQERLTISLCRMSEALSPEFMDGYDVMADSEPHQLLQSSFETSDSSQPHVGKRRMLFNAVIRSMVEVWNKVSMAIPLSPKMARRTDTNNTATTVDSTRIESPSQRLVPLAHSTAASPVNEDEVEKT